MKAPIKTLRGWLLAIAFLISLSLFLTECNGQEIPRGSQIQSAAITDDLIVLNSEIAIPYTETVQESYTVEVPYNETVTDEDGKTSTKTRTRHETRTREVPIIGVRLETRTRQLPIAQVAFYQMDGTKITKEEIGKRLVKETLVLTIPKGTKLSPEFKAMFAAKTILAVLPLTEETPANSSMPAVSEKSPEKMPVETRKKN